jgi:hypothetical protein
MVDRDDRDLDRARLDRDSFRVSFVEGDRRLKQQIDLLAKMRTVPIFLLQRYVRCLGWLRWSSQYCRQSSEAKGIDALFYNLIHPQLVIVDEVFAFTNPMQ